MTIRPFHVAFPVADLDSTKAFYEQVLGCKIGRTDEKWIDFNLFGHQITAHLSPSEVRTAATNPVDGQEIPVRHWGVILSLAEWEALAKRLNDSGIHFIVAPYIRFEGEVGEQATMFLLDPSGNALEFKAFKHDAAIFAVPNDEQH